MSIWLAKQFFRLLPGTAEVLLRGNIGRRYMATLVLSFLLYAFFALSIPLQAPLVRPFLAGYFFVLMGHFASNLMRQHRGLPDPHTYSTGDPWPIWGRMAIREDAAKRFGEPCLCFLVGSVTGIIDPFLAHWLISTAIALFVKEQVNHFRSRHRVMDMHDSRVESEQLNQILRRESSPARRQFRRPSVAHLPGESSVCGRTHR